MLRHEEGMGDGYQVRERWTGIVLVHNMYCMKSEKRKRKLFAKGH